MNGNGRGLISGKNAHLKNVTSDVQRYDGPALLYTPLPPDADLNAVIYALDGAIGSIIVAGGLQTIYNADATVLSNRNVALGGHTLAFTGGTVGIGAVPSLATLHVTGTAAISSLGGGGLQMVTASNTGVLSVQAIPAGVVIPAALSKVDDTNVTMTLGGTPLTALLQATSLTLGWTGSLAIARGGTGLTALGTTLQLLRVNAGVTALEYFSPSYISANQTITLSGAVAGSGTTAITTTYSGNLPVANLNSGTAATASTFWRGDGVWAVPAYPAGTVTSVSGTTNRITVATGTTTPVIDISASYVGQASITTVGTITTGTWTGTTIAIANGGTGQTTANTAFNALVPSQTSNTGKYLTTDGTNTSWSTNLTGWLLDGSTVGAIKKLGTIDNFELPIISNNIEQARFKTNGIFTVGSTGVSGAIFVQHTNGTNYFTYSVNGGLKVNDLYGTAGASYSAQFFGNNSCPAYFDNVQANVAGISLVANRNIALGRTGATYLNADAVSGTANDLGDAHISMKNAVSIPISSYVGGFLLYSKDRSGAGTASPFIVEESGTSYFLGSGTGSVTSIATTGPITGGTITTTGTIAITLATTSTNGYLSSTDWNTFNGKQATIITGTTAQYFRGDLSLATFPTISGTNTGDVTLAGQNYLTIASQVITANAVNLSGTNVTGVLIATSFPALTGDITTSAGALATAIGAGKVTNTMLAGSIAYSKLSLTGAILNADLAGSIAYSKLSLTGAILNADLAGSIAYSKLSLTGAILNADLAGSIAYSKLSLTGAILNADLAGSIAYTKLVGSDIPIATTSIPGFISAADWTTFNAKQSALTFTSPLVNTTGTVAIGGLSALGTANQILGMNNAATAFEYKTNAVGTAGTDFAIAQSANTVTFNLPDASATARGVISTGTQTITGDKTISASSLFLTKAASVFAVGATSFIYRTTNAGSNASFQAIFDLGNSISTAGSIAMGFDPTNGLIMTAANGTRRVMRASINLANTNNTAAAEASDIVISTMAAGAAAAERVRITSGGGLVLNATNTTVGTTGNQTINKPTGTVNIAAAGTTVTVTNSLVAATSIVHAVIRTNDTTARLTNVVPAAGSFVINIVACTAEVSIGFFVVN